MVFSNTIENTTELSFIVAQYAQIPLREQLKQDFIIEWSDLLLKGMFHVPIPLRVPLNPDFIIEWSNGTEWH